MRKSIKFSMKIHWTSEIINYFGRFLIEIEHSEIAELLKNNFSGFGVGRSPFPMDTLLIAMSQLEKFC